MLCSAHFKYKYIGVESLKSHDLHFLVHGCIWMLCLPEQWKHYKTNSPVFLSSLIHAHSPDTWPLVYWFTRRDRWEEEELWLPCLSLSFSVVIFSVSGCLLQESHTNKRDTLGFLDHSCLLEQTDFFLHLKQVLLLKHGLLGLPECFVLSHRLNMLSLYSLCISLNC